MKLEKNKKIKSIIYIFLFILFLSLSINLIIRCFNKDNKSIINYKEQSTIDYKVYLKENNFYEEKYLNKDMLYIASLIDNISIDFNYIFLIDKSLDLTYTYDIIGKLIISSENSNSSYFEKEYKLAEPKTLSITDKDNFNIRENLIIDYNYYNTLANNFKMAYGIDPVSTLTIYLRINKNNSSTIIDNTSMMSITIPLSEKSINIKMDYKDINETNNVIETKDNTLRNTIYIIISIIFIIISIIFNIKFMRILHISNISPYDKYLKKILREYDRLIVETTSIPDIKNNKIITINKFTELIDVRDNLKLPIMYYIKIPHKESYFYIKHHNEIYLYILKESNL